MNGLVDIVEALTTWLNEKVCPQIELLEPDDDFMDETYVKKRVKPKAYPLFSPYGNNSPEYAIPGTPGIVVSVLEGSDNLKEGTRTLQIQLQLISWAPGAYASDLNHVIEDPKAPLGRKYYKTDPKDYQAYQRTKDGWKDSYLFLDTVLREIQRTEFVAGMRIKIKDGDLVYGHYRDDTGPIDLYPYWINYIRFELETGRIVPSDKYQDKL